MFEADQQRDGGRERYSWAWVLFASLTYFALSTLTMAALNMAAFRRTEHVVSIFPASGAALAAMLLTPRSRRPWLFLGIAVADFWADQLVGHPVLVAHLLFAPIMGLEAWLGALFCERLAGGRRLDLGRLAGLGHLALGAGLGSTLVCGLLGGLAQVAIFRAPLLSSTWEWWIPDLVACLVVTPALLLSVERLMAARRPLRPRRLAEGLALLGGFAAVLWQLHFRAGAAPSQVPLMVAVLPFLVWAALRLGPLGTAWVSLFLTGFSVVATGLGRGPFVASAPMPFMQIIWSQLFSVVASLAMLALAIALAERLAANRDLSAAIAEVRATQARIQAYFQETPDPIAMVDTDLRLVAFNPRWAELWAGALGRPPRNGDPLLDLTPAEARDGTAELGCRALLGGRFRAPFALPEQVPGRFEASFAPLHDSDGEVIGVSLALWNLEELEERHRSQARSQRLESMGRLAGGVAHDFNNIITAMLGYGDLLLGQLEGQVRAGHYVQEILRAANRAAALAGQLLAYARRQVVEPRLVDANGLITDLVPMLTRLLGESIQLAWAGTPEPWQVKVDPGQLEQVVVNLVVNARDAMAAGGKLTLETANVHLDRPVAHRREVAPGDYLQVSVSDTGTGIPAAILERIFEPFYTTKGGAQGTGLGLATVEGSIRQAGGAVLVYSELGVGTVFKVLLPRAYGSPEAAQPAPEPQRRGGDERVLIVEDDEALRVLSGRILEDQGYRTLALGSGEAALALDDRELAGFSLLLTDVVLPGIHGRDLANALRLRIPALKVLYVSGYTENSVIRLGVLQPGVQFLAKPYSAQKLLGAVRIVLDSD